MKKAVIQLAVLIGFILLINTATSVLAKDFNRYIFTPLQIVRCRIFASIPFSIGDLLYLSLGIYILYLAIRFIRKFRSRNSLVIALALLYGSRSLLIFYLVLLVLWGINYEQPKLSKQLALSVNSVSDADLISFDSLLIKRLNDLQPQYTILPFDTINSISHAIYQKQQSPIQVLTKPTLIGNSLTYFGIEGYFNPFTGEAQVNNQNLHFMQPFVVAHEMAHQSGIAAEDDANLLAYITCVESNNKSFQYSAYFNIWLYTHRRVRGIDSTIANNLKAQLNAASLAQLDTMRQRRIKYQTVLDDISTFIFDAYLRMGNQKDGIKSYRNVAYSALSWERKKRIVL